MIKLFFIFLLMYYLNISAQTSNQSIRSLRGITNASIVVESFNQTIHDSGLRENEIKSDAWFELQSAGIDIINLKTSIDVPGSPYLYINIGAVKSKKEDLYAVSINIEFRQDVFLTRDPKDKYYGATTWSRTNVGLFSKDKISEVRNFTKSIIADFVKDYLLANKMKRSNE